MDWQMHTILRTNVSFYKAGSLLWWLPSNITTGQTQSEMTWNNLTIKSYKWHNINEIEENLKAPFKDNLNVLF